MSLRKAIGYAAATGAITLASLVSACAPKAAAPTLEISEAVTSPDNPFAAFLPAHWNEVRAAKTFNLSPLECSVADANG